jgi:hypothetical protein
MFCAAADVARPKARTSASEILLSFIRFSPVDNRGQIAA